MTVEGDSISRNAEFTKLEQVRPSSASKRPEGHLHTALGPGAKTHRWEQAMVSQGLSALSWDSGWMIYSRHMNTSGQSRRLTLQQTVHPVQQ